MFKPWLLRLKTWYLNHWAIPRVDAAATALSKNASIEPVLLLFKPEAIGDYLLFRHTLPAYKAYALSKSLKLVLIGQKGWKALAEQWDADTFDEVIWIDRLALERQPKARKQWLQLWQKRGVDTIVYPCYHRSPSIDGLIGALKARHKLAVMGDTFLQPRKSLLLNGTKYTEVLDLKLDGVHELDKHTAIAKAITGKELNSIFTLPIEALPHYQVPTSTVMAFVGGSTADKRWPEENWLSLLRQYPSSRFIICGLSKEVSASFIESIDCLPNTQNWLDKTTLPQLAGLVKAVSLVISGDTSAAHFAAALRTPAIVLYNGHRYGSFLPYPSHLGWNHSLAMPEAIKALPKETLYQQYAGNESSFIASGISLATVLELFNKHTASSHD